MIHMIQQLIGQTLRPCVATWVSGKCRVRRDDRNERNNTQVVLFHNKPIVEDIDLAIDVSLGSEPDIAPATSHSLLWKTVISRFPQSAGDLTAFCTSGIEITASA